MATTANVVDVEHFANLLSVGGFGEAFRQLSDEAQGLDDSAPDGIVRVELAALNRVDESSGLRS